ncbi:type II/IV secretion system ATPase subunit [Haloarchaeobius sp. TZWWS8]|uniref:type II/IV secretion system ATPase subunit n=1 Tax=Haloarchaeobius sp. TZWWS8 TaxID=3446121 RepID=UPI003EBBB6AB
MSHDEPTRELHDPSPGRDSSTPAPKTTPDTTDGKAGPADESNTTFGTEKRVATVGRREVTLETIRAEALGRTFPGGRDGEDGENALDVFRVDGLGRTYSGSDAEETGLDRYAGPAGGIVDEADLVPATPPAFDVGAFCVESLANTFGGGIRPFDEETGLVPVTPRAFDAAAFRTKALGHTFTRATAQPAETDAPPVEPTETTPPTVDPADLVLWAEQRSGLSKEEIIEVILTDVKQYYAGVTLDTAFADRPSDEFIDNRWFDFSYLDDLLEVERYWVNRPYAYASVLFSPDRKEFQYEVTEVSLDGFERYVREDLTRILRNSLMYHDVGEGKERETIFEEKAKEIIAEHAATVENGSIYKLLYYLLRDFLDFGKLDPMMRDQRLEDISCDGVDVPVFVYHDTYRDLRSNVVFDRDRLSSFTVRLAQRAGKHISVSDPLVDASLPDGSRIQLTLGSDIATRGSNFTIRKFADVPYTPVDLIKWNTFGIEQMAYFWLAIENNKSLVFAGGTGSGKTTSMNAIGFFIPPNSKVVSIEDTREITLPHDNWIQSVSRPAVTEGGRGEVSMYELLQASLRQRPEYLLVGEIRTEQRVGLTFFNAIATGHTSYTTIHADSVEGALSRLENAPLSIPVQMVQDLDVIAIQRQIFADDTRVRRNQVVAEILPGDDPTTVETREVFRWNPRTDTYELVGESHLLAEIADERGWTTAELEAELNVRIEVLRHLVQNDVTDYDDVTHTIHTFQRDRDAVLDAIREDDLSERVLARAQ